MQIKLFQISDSETLNNIKNSLSELLTSEPVFNDNIYRFVCELAGTVLGTCAITKNGNESELFDLNVREEYRGKGIGKKLVKAALNKAYDEGFLRVIAELPAERLEFFESCGMAHSGVTYLKDGKRCIKCEKSFVFRDAEWIGFNGETEAVFAVKRFKAQPGKKAELIISGLGFCEIYLNGEAVSDRLCAPAWTNYAPLDTQRMGYPLFDKFTYRILYEKIDVTDFLREGENELVIHLGGGWLCQHESRNEGVTAYGKLMLCFSLSIEGAIVAKSDRDVRCHRSYITRQNIYFGEKQDLRIGNYSRETMSFDPEKSFDPEIISEPLAVFSEQHCPHDRIIRTIEPELIFKKGDHRIYDLGENTVGYPVVDFENTSRDEVIYLRFSETLDDDGALSFNTTGGNSRIQREEYIYDGKAKSAHSHFTWHAGRYFDVLGSAQVKEFKVVHTDLKQKARFISSDETLQWIFDSFIRTQLNNTHCCIPSDCPHRERLGYTGDGQWTSNAVMDCFEAEDMYRKWMQDIADSQDVFTGHVAHTAPFYGGGGGPGGWSGAIVFVPYNFYKHYGDKEILRKYYPNMLLYLDYLDRHSENGLVVSTEPGSWCLGDWCSPGNKNLIPPPFINTYFHLKALEETIEIADILGYDAEKLRERKEETARAFKAAYFDPESGTFAGSTEASDAFAFDLGLGNEKTLQAIVDKYEALGEFDTGIFGTYVLIKTLCLNDKKELARKLLTSEKENTYYNMMSHGATTIWENWEGCHSHDHPMFGAIVEFLLKYFNEA